MRSTRITMVILRSRKRTKAGFRTIAADLNGDGKLDQNEYPTGAESSSDSGSSTSSMSQNDTDS